MESWLIQILLSLKHGLCFFVVYLRSISSSLTTGEFISHWPAVSASIALYFNRNYICYA